MDEIKQYNGEDKKPAYVVIGGKVYDVSNSYEWINGRHYGVKAGADLTSYYNMCHKDNENIIGKIKYIGILVQ